jgi:pilus biogenesis lipoprotein CpaD
MQARAHTSRHGFVRILLPLLALAFSAACAEVPYRDPVVIYDRASHTILFDGREAQLKASERLSLERFMKDLGPVSVTDMSLTAPESGGLTDRRVRALESVLARSGLPRRLVAFVEPEAETGVYILHVEFARAAGAFGCPDWSQSTVNYGNAMHSNYGCATARNLAAQVADPEDLIHGHGAPSPDADRTALVVGHYHSGADIAAPAAAVPGASGAPGTSTTSPTSSAPAAGQ